MAVDGSRDATAQVARSRADVLRYHGHDLIVIDLEQAGKAAALNAADQYADADDCRIYLGADVTLTPDAVASVHRALHAAPVNQPDPPNPPTSSDLPEPPVPPVPRLVSPRPRFVPEGPSRLAAGFFAVWSHLPAVRGRVIGGGCHAVNGAGRALWDRFPALTADDAYVRGRFAPDQIQVVDGEFVTGFPDRARLIRVVRRWRAGHHELADAGHGTPSAGLTGNLLFVARSPSLWRHLPAFATVLLLTRITRASPADHDGPAWTR